MTTIIVIPKKSTVIVDGDARIAKFSCPTGVLELQCFSGLKAIAILEDGNAVFMEESAFTPYLAAWESAGANQAALEEATVKEPARDVLAELDSLKARVSALEGK